MIDELRHLVLIAEHGTFTEAARHAHLSQPALTASVQRLEALVGTKLLARGRHGAEPTAAGAAFLGHARAALAALDDGIRAATQIAGLAAGEVRLGAGATVCSHYLPGPIAAFRAQHPAIRFVLREMTTDEALEALAWGALDLAIVTAAEGDPWLRDELVLVGPPGTRTIGALPFVALRPGATTRALLERRFAGAEIVMELGSIAAVKENVRAGAGVALISRRAVEEDVAAGRLALVPDARTPIFRPLRIVHRGVDRLAPASAALRRMLLDHAPRRAGRRSRG